MRYKKLDIDKTWTLFLDRDGVINVRIPDNYVKSIEQFQFEDGSLEAIAILSTLFNRIIIVSNQQGVGKGLMTIDDLEKIHDYFINAVNNAGGHIDKIYVSPYLESVKHFSRKPSVGMGIQAKRDFKDISFKRSVMVGDSISDIKFGKRLGMKTIFIGHPSQIAHCSNLVDYCYHSLLDFAKSINNLNSSLA